MSFMWHDYVNIHLLSVIISTIISCLSVFIRSVIHQFSTSTYSRPHPHEKSTIKITRTCADVRVDIRRSIARRKRNGGGKAERRSPAKVKESNRSKTLRQWSDQSMVGAMEAVRLQQNGIWKDQKRGSENC